MQTLGLVGYGCAAFAFAVLGLLVSTNWSGFSIATRLTAACAVTAVWGAVLARDAYSPVDIAVVYCLEIVCMGTWLVVLTSAARWIVPPVFRRLTHLLWTGTLVASVAMLFLERAGMTNTGMANRFFLTAGLLLSLAGLILLEHTYRNTTQDARQAMRYFAVAVGMILVYNLFMYAQGMMLNLISEGVWAVRGFAVALSVPLFMIAARKNTEWSIDLFVSRQVVFHTATLLAVGLYLCVMALSGYYVRLASARWTVFAQLFFFAGAGLVLMWLLSSVSLRRQMKVFISKHFYSNKYDYRVQWLEFIGALSKSAREEEVSCTALRAVAQVFESSGGILFWATEGSHTFAPTARWSNDSGVTLPAEVIAVDSGLVRLLEARQWILDLVEYRKNREIYDNVELPAWLEKDSSLRIVSPVSHRGKLRGFIVLLAPPAPFELTYEDRDLLRILGVTIAMYITQHESRQELAEARQFEVFSRLTAFMMHDLKNAAAQLTLVVRNAEKHRHNPDFFDDAISTIANASERIEKLIAQLRGATVPERIQKILIDHTVDHAVSRCLGRLPTPVAHFADEDMWVMADLERLTSVLEHLLRNAQQATSEHGEVRIELARHGGHASICIWDNGTGMTPEFVRERLFRPFDSTKGDSGMGIGAYQAREYVCSLGGEINVESQVGQGTRIEVRLPLVA